MDEILIEVAGPGATTDMVASRELLELASAYVDGLIRVAHDEFDELLTITGLAVVPKCVAVRVFSDKPSVALESGETIQAALSGTEEAPKGVHSVVERIRRAVYALPPTYEPAARFHESGGEHVLQLLVQRAPAVLPPREVIEVRATPIRAGGSRATARFDARSEPKPFTLVAKSRDVVRSVGAALWKPCDIVAKVARDAEGKITAGNLIEFSVAAPDSAAVWERWYRENRDNLSPGPEEGEDHE